MSTQILASDRPSLLIKQVGRYWIKTFGGTLSDFRFVQYPAVIQRARTAFPDIDVTGFLLCALELPPRMSGLLFCDPSGRFPDGLPVRTEPIKHQYERDGWRVVETDGGMFVVAHWYHENGAIGPFYQLH